MTSHNENKSLVQKTKTENNNVVEQSETSTQHKNTETFSPQKQLLFLAKEFSLDGAMLPEDKQPPLEDRVLLRQQREKLRQQKNLEDIVLQSMKYCTDGAISERIDPDWFNQFNYLAQDISNKTMQNLWAKILANEVSSPGSFSLKTLQVFREMTINEAKLFAKACRIAISDARKKNIRIITGGYQPPSIFNFFNKQRQQALDLNQFGLGYADILTLANNHLLYEQETESNQLKPHQELVFHYNGKIISITPKKSQCILTFYKFTPVGSELATLITDKPDDNYLSVLHKRLAENFIIR